MRREMPRVVRVVLAGLLAMGAMLAMLALSGCSGIRYITQDLQGKSVIVVKSGWGVDLSVGAVSDSGAPVSIEAGKIATVYVSSKDGDKLPAGLADIIRAARGDLEIKATGIKESAGK